MSVPPESLLVGSLEKSWKWNRPDPESVILEEALSPLGYSHAVSGSPGEPFMSILNEATENIWPDSKVIRLDNIHQDGAVREIPVGLCLNAHCLQKKLQSSEVLFIHRYGLICVSRRSADDALILFNDVCAAVKGYLEKAPGH